MKLKNQLGILQQNLKDPLSRKVAVHKQHVKKWRRVMLLGKKAAMRRVTMHYTIWLVLMFIVLGLLSGFWASPQCQDKSFSIKSSWAIAVLPCDFLLLFVAALDMSPTDRVEQILQQMRHKHKIADLSRTRHDILFPQHGYAPIDLTDTLCDVGIHDLSVIHIRISIPGGSSNPGRNMESGSSIQAPHQFTSETGNFPSKRPDVWEPTGDQRFRCLICPDHEPVPSRQISSHEETIRHTRNLNNHENLAHSQASGSRLKEPYTAGAGQNTSRVPLERVGGVLSQTLAQLAKGKGSSSHGNQYSYLDDHSSGGVDWNSDMMDFNTQLQQPLDVQTTIQLGKNLQAYLNEEGDLDHDSDDDLDERSHGSDSESSVSDDEHPPATGRRRRQVDPDRESEWFPWPDKETCVLDILRHVPH
ncbi:hypothetical protein B0H11DRAFT_2194146, partial [Mycena galericulata]